jgi:F420H(2)-dependent quinone reductase
MQLVAKAVLWLHVTLYRLTNGRIGGRFIAGSPILLLTTTGRKTGKRRTRALAYVRDGEGFVLCASNGGSPQHPGWYHNLCATGRAEIQVGPEHLAVSARTPTRQSAAGCSPRLAEVNPGVQLSAAVRLVTTVVRWSMPQTCPEDPDSGLQPYVL